METPKAPMGTIIVEEVPAASTRPLRHAVLRPNQPMDACIYPGDDDPKSTHFAAYQGASPGEESIVGVASLYAQGLDEQPEDGSWRLRGMATREQVRGKGYGSALAEACIRHVREQGGYRLWCNGRTTVLGFYSRFGFAPRGEEFDIPGLGPHYVMELILGGPS